MFDLLKKKMAAFTEKVTRNIQPPPISSPEPADGTTLPEPVAPGKPETQHRERSRELKAKPSFGKRVKGLVTGKVLVSGKDIADLLEELELSLLEADVEQGAAEHMVHCIKESLTGKELDAGDVSGQVKKEIQDILHEMMEVPGIDVLERMKEKKPYVILFLGPNGAGKTTSIAKMVRYLSTQGKKAVLASCDTFRAGSIEQLKMHAEKLGVRMIHHQYGSDPAAVAFDAIASAKAKGEDVVLIDSAGRQETNKNLMQELEKLVRVAKPDLKIYVGESYTGQALLQQAREFDAALGLDGFILTKMDTDPKGGTALSLLYVLKKPILFFGVGQQYKDLEPFDAGKITARILGN